MILDHVLLGVFIASNLGIMAGYIFVALFVAPHLKVRLLRTKLGGIVFFATCGLTHFELALHAAFFPDEPYREMFTSIHMLLIHTVQVVSVWLFVTGLYREFVLPFRRRS